MLGEFPFIGELLADLKSVPIITDAKPVVLDDIDINRDGLELREVSDKPAKKKKATKAAAKKSAPKAVKKVAKKVTKKAVKKTAKKASAKAGKRK